MKATRNILVYVIMSFLVTFTSLAPAADVQAEAQVLVTKTGSKYHTRKCGNGTYYYVSLSTAKARGLTPCSKCYGSNYTGTSSSSASNSSSKGSNNTTKKPKAISLSKTSMELVKGSSKKITVKNASGAIKWSSSNKSVATVSNNGTVTAKSKGKATITVSANGQTKSCKVTVEEPKISKSSLQIEVEDSKQITITGCKHNVTWSSSNTTVAYIDEEGYIYADTPGTATITGKVHGKKYTCKVTVTAPKIAEIEISNPIETLETNDLFYLYITTDNNSIFEYEDIKVSSSDPSILSVSAYEDEIEVSSSNQTGTATITVSIGGQEISCTITVVEADA